MNSSLLGSTDSESLESDDLKNLGTTLHDKLDLLSVSNPGWAVNKRIKSRAVPSNTSTTSGVDIW